MKTLVFQTALCSHVLEKTSNLLVEGKQRFLSLESLLAPNLKSK